MITSEERRAKLAPSRGAIVPVELARYEAGESIETRAARPALPRGAQPFDLLRF